MCQVIVAILRATATAAICAPRRARIRSPKARGLSDLLCEVGVTDAA
jgi:hypothetical protein